MMNGYVPAARQFHAAFAVGKGLPAGLLLAAMFCLSACSSVPESNIRQPLSVRPQPQPPVADNNGAIFQPRQALALFEDRRARHIGDTLTVNLVERTSATRTSQTTEDRSATADINIPTPTVLGSTPGFLGNTAWTPETSVTQDFSDNDSNSNTISGAITVSVVEVLANGNLVVAGEKQIGINNDTEYIRLAGVVNPATITAANTVNSTQLADVQIESKTGQSLDKAQLTSMLARFFLTVLPF